jgi:hypothetical protein
MKKYLLAASISYTLSISAAYAETAVTIYSKLSPGSVPPELYMSGAAYNNNYGDIGYGIIRETRKIKLDKEISEVKFTDVAEKIDPTTVSFKSLTDASTSVMEQNFAFDLVSTEKLLQKFIDKEISLETTVGDHVDQISGTLISSAGAIVLQQKNGEIASVNSYNKIKYPVLPDGLMTKPTLIWMVKTAKTGEHNVETSYETKGITWWADYNATYIPDGQKQQGKLDVTSWVSILNQSGASYKDSKLKLIAGQPNRSQPQFAPMAARMEASGMAMDMAAEKGFQEKSFNEYHMYSLGRTTTIPNKSTKQVELFPAIYSIPVSKVLVLRGSGGAYPAQYSNPDSFQNAEAYIKFSNSEKNKLGMALPAGRVRIFEQDKDGSKEFIGEDVIKHTPRDEEVLIKTGDSFDVVGSRKILESTSNQAARTAHEAYEITLNNHKDSPAELMLIEDLNGRPNWEIKNESMKFEKKDAYTIAFRVSLPSKAKQVIKYSVDWKW